MGRYTEMKIMVLNHTNIDGNHFGCQKVEDNIRIWLKRLGATQTTFVPTGTKNYSAELHATASSVDAPITVAVMVSSSDRKGEKRNRTKKAKKEKKEEKRRRRDNGPDASGLSGPTEISGDTRMTSQ